MSLYKRYTHVKHFYKKFLPARQKKLDKRYNSVYTKMRKVNIVKVSKSRKTCRLSINASEYKTESNSVKRRY